jgi:tRNA(Arg) A34 adenosine deaminase TadA
MAKSIPSVNRRGFLKGAAAGAAALVAKPQLAAAAPATNAPVLSEDDPLAQLWDKNVSDVATLKPSVFTPERAEQHRLYSLALMSLVRQYWNGNKDGSTGNYGQWRERQVGMKVDGGFIYRRSEDATDYAQLDYLGHNIACLAVDGDGDIIDFDFNHNNIFNSSVEHAEARLVRRIFSLTQLDKGWNLSVSTGDAVYKPGLATNLNNVTVYTSLESCAQCSGIMALAQVKEVVYLQKDFGSYCIGNIMYNLTTRKDGTRTGVPAPKPIPGSDFGFPYYDDLSKGFQDFYKKVKGTPFWTDGKTVDNIPAVTSFLCTDAAFAIYKRADEEFKNCKSTLNEALPDKVRTFVNRMVEIGGRGTPHKL